ncbi:hypothetical protein G7077_03890 [Sphingomonas piscis]|uniref:PilZ domain-containing protein n=1 Tax=Sphingomonas piscis TaxID=2714943 RepID=A0A6G7YN78_9SPHN|nr:hypothetical protein [Sphingomonas piscis]QIK78176.1 hypothetical protein G7077_03890 [Sphingomonas piscis]
MKPREQRRNVLIKARMRIAERWGDALILNMSSRGLLIQSRQPPRRGEYIEIRRGKHVIIARAVWSGEDRFGVQTQDVIAMDAVIHEPDKSLACPVATETIERRAAQRPTTGSRFEDNRLVGRLLEFACFIFVGATAASIAFFAVGDALARPFSSVTASLE